MGATINSEFVGRPNAFAARFAPAWCLFFFPILTGCSDFGFFRTKLDPNAYPVNYKADLVAYVRVHPIDMLDAREAFVSAPGIKQFGSENRYFVCLRAEGNDWRKEKFVVFHAGKVNQLIDAIEEQCDPGSYESFPELLPELNKPRQKK